MIVDDIKTLLVKNNIVYIFDQSSLSFSIYSKLDGLDKKNMNISILFNKI